MFSDAKGSNDMHLSTFDKCHKQRKQKIEMVKNYFNASKWFQAFFLLINIVIIFLSCFNYLTKEQSSNIFIQTNCRINQISTQQIICPKTRKKIASDQKTAQQVEKLCTNTLYGIIHQNNSFALVDQSPTWLSASDLIKLHKYLKTAWVETVLKSVNIPCYYNSFNHSQIRWTQTDSKSFIQIILFTFFAIGLTLLYFFDECYRQRRINM
jgi:hypothetical protein